MLYDLHNSIDRERLKRRMEQLLNKEGVVEVTEKTNRTKSQNSYLHLILGYFAMETGNTLEYVKQEYFKRLVNRSTFVRVKEDRYLGEVETLRSSAEVTKEEMTMCIERFRTWSSMEGGIYLPSADDQRFLKDIEMEMGRYQNRQYL